MPRAALNRLLPNKQSGPHNERPPHHNQPPPQVYRLWLSMGLCSGPTHLPVHVAKTPKSLHVGNSAFGTVQAFA